MSITSLQFVLNQFEQEKYRYFIIFDEEGDPIYVQNDLLDQESAIARLRSFFRDNNGYFTIKVFSKKLSNTKNRIEQDKCIVAKFNVESTVAISGGLPSVGMGMVPQGGLPPDDPRSNAPNIYSMMQGLGEITTQMKLMEKDHQHYREMKELQDRLERMEKEGAKSAGMGGLVSTIADNFKDPSVLLGLLSGAAGLFKKEPVMPMNGIGDEVDANVLARKAKMVAAVNILMVHDSEFPENVSMLAELCQTKPDVYKMAVTYLKSM